MKLKYYLRGAGFGMIMATFVLMIAFGFSGNNNNSESKDESLVSTEHGTTVLNAVASDNEEKVLDTENKEEATDTKKSEDTEAVAAEENSSQSTEVTGTIEYQDEENASADSEEELNKDAEEAAEDNVTKTVIEVVSVVGGQTSNVVAAHLEEAGIIEDASDFNTYLTSNGYDTMICPGTYEFTVGSNYETIANILMGR